MSEARQPRGRVFDVQRFSLHDGPGIRTVVFLKGCPLRCAWCANPESQRPEPEVAWFAARCAACGRCAGACPEGAIRVECGVVYTDRRACTACGDCAAACAREARRLMGREMTVDEVMAEVRRDAVFYRRSGGGVTFSGGEPLAQPRFLLEALRRSRRWGYHTAVETCGQAPWRDLRVVAAVVDLFLYDVKHLDSRRHRELVGCGNRLILENLERLLAAGVALTVRVPVVPGCNDGPAEVEALAAFAAAHPTLQAVELLPHHRLGEHKYAALGRPAPAVDDEPAAPVGDEAAAQMRGEPAAPVDGEPAGWALDDIAAAVSARAGVRCTVTRGVS